MGLILLVRHGQASFGSENYDRLSPLGEAQARILGAALAGSIPGIDTVVAGSLSRQRATAERLLEATAWDAGLTTDARWNEFDHDGLVDDVTALTDSGVFQTRLESGLREWTAGRRHPAETFESFHERARTALEQIRAGAGPGSTSLVVSSGGVISWLAGELLGGGVDQWLALNRVMVNTGLTKIVTGRRGASLVSFNEHGHLATPEITYR